MNNSSKYYSYQSGDIPNHSVDVDQGTTSQSFGEDNIQKGNYNNDLESSFAIGSSNDNIETAVSRYATNVPIRLDFEAALAYLFGCVSGILLLIFERQNDYIRFHAYQSCLTSLVMFVSITIISLILPFLAIILKYVTILLFLYLSFRAYSDSATLDYFMLPYIGNTAYKWVSTE
ncbi:hypothetical protein BB559_000398 [Furculomyces boomerangus]|uniref:Uncharacterized protein n=1 Tax=Furculomyces boomerangus TaxID=61424 RepID=A0A2T9Z5B0_9FUNG|nr:hypothetical protein BB559_000398 [Furculomyces boomerangus]